MAKKKKYVAICRRHWASCWRRLILIAFLLLLTYGGLIGKQKEDIYLGCLFFALALLVGGSIFISCRYNYVALTEDGLVSYSYFLFKVYLPFHSILSAGTTAGYLGMMFDCYTIEIKCVDKDYNCTFKRMAKARKFVNQIPTHPLFRG